MSEQKYKLTDDQYLRFKVLVPFYTEMDIKRQKEAGSLVKKSAHPIYDKAIAKLKPYAEKNRLEGAIAECDHFIEDNPNSLAIDYIKARREELIAMRKNYEILSA